MSTYGPKVHDFRKSLALSNVYTNAPWWEKVYRRAFPTFAVMHSVRNDGWAQRGGIDRVILLRSGKNIWVDEKVRTQDYPDILLEQWSDVERKRPGWVQKDLACDFIAYAFAPTQICFLLPFHQLRRAWRTHGQRWVREYETVRAPNKGYTTVSIAVPTFEVLQAIKDAMRVDWE